MRSRPQSGTFPPTRGGIPSSTRKIFNCIIDDTALVAGVKKSTRNGIRHWVKHGHIRLFVPLFGEFYLLKNSPLTATEIEDKSWTN